MSFYTDTKWIAEYNCIYKTFTVPWEKSKIVYFASSRIKWILVFLALSKFAGKLICWISLGSEFIAYSLLKSTVIILQ